jgi:hypothetical protein
MRLVAARRTARLALSIGLSALFAFDVFAAEPVAEPASKAKGRRLSYWDHGEPRFFAASRLELGLYAKPQVAVGYGKPYWMNATAEAFGITTLSFGAGYAGIRGSLSFLDLRVGARYTLSYDRSFLPPKEHYVAADVSSSNDRPLARYLSLETELSGVVPLLDGFVFPVVTIYRIVDTPEGQYVFDESLRGITKPPWIMGFRLGYVKNFGKNDFIKAGVLSELIVLPGRDASIVRIGPAAQVTITDHLDAQGTITFVVSSPDSLGIWSGPFGVLGVVYRWATGDEAPAFP